MAKNRIPLRRENDIGRSYTADASNLVYALIILKQCHKPCNSSVLGTVHHLIYDIRL